MAACCAVGWVLRLGALADLLSKPVLVGYLAGIAGIMAGSQLGRLVGVSEHNDEFFREVWQVATHLGEAQGATGWGWPNGCAAARSRRPSWSRPRSP